MKKYLKISQTFVALFLTVAVINIYVTDSYCSFTKEIDHHHSSLALSEQEESHHAHQIDATEEHHHDSEEAENHHHEVNKPETANHHDSEEAGEHHHETNQPEAEHHHDGENDDNCCKDNSAAFFSSLTNPSIHAVFIKAPVNSLFYEVKTVNQLLTFDTFSSSPEYLLFRPPPNIPDIRIFIQSFII